MSKSIMQREEQKRRYRVGSRAFFEGMPFFEPKDTDDLEIVDELKFGRNFEQLRRADRKRCLFRWKRMTADEFIENALKSRTPMEAGKFLVPEVANDLGITMEHLRKLAPVFERMDMRHQYERVIFEAYLENGGMWLTDEQRRKAFEVYLYGERIRKEVL